jgi:acyl-CoA reductase-like NAD-dependent aldehyde dehydrogenase
MQLESFNPATGELVGSVPLSSADDVSAAVARARAAQPAWEALGPRGRADRLRLAGPIFAARAAELGELLSREMGKPLKEGVGEVRSVGHLDGELNEMIEAFEPVLLRDGRTVTELRHDALGVCAALTPFNFPASMISWMALPALMAGNTVVLKPSEETPLIAQAYVDVFNEVLPPDVFQIVHGRADVGRALVAADIDMIAFTGSRETGRSILQAAAPGLKRVLLELGGKDPLVVLDDADIGKAAEFAVRNSFRNAGQVCVSTERIYVHEAVADAFEAAVVAGCEALVQGPWDRDGVDVGPMIHARQRDHVLRQIDEAVAAGARVLAGGAGHRDNFVTPTVLGGVDHGMAIMRDETFGPVACIARVADDEEAIRLANDSGYGLGAVVFGGDEDRAASVARRIRAGMVGVNRGVGGAQGSPWVGAKESGLGYHGGIDGHRQFSQTRIVSRREPA